MTDSEPLDGAEAARRLRERAPDTVLVRRSRSGGGTKIHLPDADGHPRCRGQTKEFEREPREVDLAAYPPGFASWCTYCAEDFFDRDRGSIDGTVEHRGVAADGGESE